MIDALSVGLGAVTGGLVARGITALREHRTVPTALADVLVYSVLVAPGVVLHDSGCVMAAWDATGPDPAARDARARVSARTGRLFRQLGDGVMLHVDSLRWPAAPYAPSTFPALVAQWIDDERRRAYTHAVRGQYETRTVVTLTYAPPTGARGRAARWLAPAAPTGVAWSALLDPFEALRRRVEDELGDLLRLRRLDDDALCTVLHQCITGLAHRVTAPPPLTPLNAVLASRDVRPGFRPRVGNHHLRVIAVQGYPDDTEPGLLDALTELPFPLRFSTRAIVLGQRDALGLIEIQRQRHAIASRGLKDRAVDAAQQGQAPGGVADVTAASATDAHAVSMTLDAQRAAAAIRANDDTLCLVTHVVVVSDPDPEVVDARAEAVLRAIGDAGCTANDETVNAFEAWLGSLPGHGAQNVRLAPMSGQALGNLLPFASVWPGRRHSPNPYLPSESPPLYYALTDGRVPYRFHLHVSDVGHALVVGPTGSGKSTFLCTLVPAFLRYPNAQVFYFDVGGSAWPITAALGGRYYDLAAGTPDAVRFQPLARVDEPTEAAAAIDWLVRLVERQLDAHITPAQHARLERAVLLVGQSAPAHRTLAELWVHLQEDALTAAVQPYLTTGPYGALLDADRDDLADGAVHVVELRQLLEVDSRVGSTVLDYLLRRIEQRLDGRPTLIVIDEAWQALMQGTFGDRIRAWLLQLRKLNAAVVLATQSLAQLAQHAHRHTIFESVATTVLLPNPRATDPGTRTLYHEIGLSDDEIALLADDRTHPKRHYYVRSRDGARRIELGLGPIERAFLTTPQGMTTADQRRAMEAFGTWGDQLAAAWLDALGIPMPEGARVRPSR